ncbi:MAG: hypothetical protein CBC12_07540 [Candidatus Puniceispirillum sp. TMED52]|nr:MAG: hypothetical protein CBC12_07540 [Candidatus Puniceispirillum sp. TMED52]
MFVAVQHTMRYIAQPNTWMEVVRVGSWTGEPKNYGCWFWKGKGSGTFINTGTTLTVESIKSIKSLNLERNDFTWAPELRARNITSFHVLHTHAHLPDGMNQWVTTPYEVLVVNDECMHSRPRYSACIPRLDVRAGQWAELPCTCYLYGSFNCKGQIERALKHKKQKSVVTARHQTSNEMNFMLFVAIYCAVTQTLSLVVNIARLIR